MNPFPKVHLLTIHKDIQQATQIAVAMVTQMGMSYELGNVDFQSDYNRLSSETQQRIENEVRRIVEEGKERARKLLTLRRKELDLLANALVEYESLNREEMEKVVRGEKLPDKLTTLPGVPLKLPETLFPPAGIDGAARAADARPSSSGDNGAAAL